MENARELRGSSTLEEENPHEPFNLLHVLLLRQD